MSRYLIFLLLILLSSMVHSDELTEAYQKEYAYLVGEKEAIQKRLQSLKSRNASTLNKLKAEIRSSERRYLELQNKSDRMDQQILAASRSADTVESDSALLNTTLLQAAESLATLDLTVDTTSSTTSQLAEAIRMADEVIQADGAVNRKAGSYFQTDGTSLDAEIIQVGRIARYGISENTAGLLYPSGNGSFSLWESDANPNTKQFAAGEAVNNLDIFLYDNANKPIEKREEKQFADELEASGIVGKVILVLGLLGLLFVVLRFLFLSAFSSNVHKVANKVDQVLKDSDSAEALAKFERGKGSAHRVIAKTVRHLNKDRNHIEDIISESILHERSRIDRFRTIILVFAAIAPLLGLLGTVTGMITTFDIITEFGTGDPKLLSTGISEALLTTKFGLMVAIPLLLLGNVLSSWGSRIKNDLEQAALYVLNTHKA